MITFSVDIAIAKEYYRQEQINNSFIVEDAKTRLRVIKSRMYPLELKIDNNSASSYERELHKKLKEELNSLEKTFK